MDAVREWPHVKVVIVPADQPHVAIMHLLTEGISRGGILPFGAEWTTPPNELGNGYWIRPPTPEVIEHQILKWRQLDAVYSDGTSAARPAPLRWYIAKPSDIPTDRTYRNAQVAHPTEAKVVHDMPMARELHRDLLRSDRADMLMKLDGEWFGAMRAKDEAKVAAVDAEKQVLLDATDDPRIEAATTIDELKVVTCERLVQEAVARGDIVRAEPVALDVVP